MTSEYLNLNAMKNIIRIYAVLITVQCVAQNFHELSPDLGKRAYEHVVKLSEFGTRSPGSVAEENTIGYLKEQFSEINMNVEIDTFNYTWMNLNNRQIVLNGKNFPVQTFYVINSFQDTINLTAECFVFRSSNISSLEVKNKIVLSNESNHVILLKKYSPKAIIVFTNDVFKELIQFHKSIVDIQIPVKAKSKRMRSFNLIASYNSSESDRKDIIITAHWDSQNGPGADDNASGVSILVELARYFSPYVAFLPYDLKFVATGAEEKGLIGSKSYILKHSDDLEHCLLNINIDGVGNGKKVYIEMKNPIEFKDRDTSSVLELISTDSFEGNLYTSFLEIYRNSSSTHIYPKWLKKNIKSAMKELKYRYSKASCCSGADHRSFAYLNIPVVYLTIISRGKNKLRHTPNDVPKPLFIQNLDKAGDIVSKIVINTCNNRGLKNK